MFVDERVIVARWCRPELIYPSVCLLSCLFITYFLFLGRGLHVKECQTLAEAIIYAATCTRAFLAVNCARALQDGEGCMDVNVILTCTRAALPILQHIIAPARRVETFDVLQSASSRTGTGYRCLVPQHHPLHLHMFCGGHYLRFDSFQSLAAFATHGQKLRGFLGFALCMSGQRPTSLCPPPSLFVPFLPHPGGRWLPAGNGVRPLPRGSPSAPGEHGRRTTTRGGERRRYRDQKRRR